MGRSRLWLAVYVRGVGREESVSGRVCLFVREGRCETKTGRRERGKAEGSQPARMEGCDGRGGPLCVGRVGMWAREG